MSDTSTAELFQVLDATKKQIRLLTLFPGRRGSQVECSLAVISLLSNPKYKALSYEWGSTDSVNEIVVNDRKLRIRDNLWWALNYLRKDDCEIVIWIDAICIDQSNLSERNYQVELMREIFTCAILVEAWIGLGSEGSAKVFEILRELNREASTGERYTRQDQKARDRPVESQWVSWMNSEPAFDDVFERSYWNRVWIIQEVVAAKELFIRCGEDSIRWHPGFVQEFDRAAFKHPDQMWVFGFFSAGFVLNFRYNGADRSLASLVAHASSCGATEVKDKFFAMLGIANDVLPGAIPVDYNKSLEDIKDSVATHCYGEELWERWKSVGRSLPYNKIDPASAYYFFWVLDSL